MAMRISPENENGAPRARHDGDWINGSGDQEAVARRAGGFGRHQPAGGLAAAAPGFAGLRMAVLGRHGALGGAIGAAHGLALAAAAGFGRTEGRRDVVGSYAVFAHRLDDGSDDRLAALVMQR